MKKHILILIIIFATIPTKAQIKDNQQYYKAANNPSSSQTKQYRRGANGYTGWFKYIDVLDAIASDPANLNPFVNLISYDSNLVQIFAAGERQFVSANSFGSIIDPTDPDWNEMQIPIAKSDIFNQHSTYTFDSLEIPFLYIRNVDSMEFNGTTEKLIDTLFIQYFLKPHLMMFNFDQMSLIPDSLNVATGMAHNYLKIDTLLLNENFATEKTAENTFRLQMLRLYVGLENKLPDGVNGKHDALYRGLTNTWEGQDDWRKSCMGFHAIFKSMKPTVMGDTMDASDGSTVTNKHNYFGYRFIRDANPRDAQVENIAHFNGSFIGRKDLRYGQIHYSSRPEKYAYKHFLPSRAFFEKQYHDVSFKLSTKHSTAVKNINEMGYGATQIFPNPTHNIAYLNIALKKASDVKINIFNISGKKVYTNSTYAAMGNSILTFNTSNLAKGIYLANITINNNTFTRKFIVE